MGMCLDKCMMKGDAVVMKDSDDDEDDKASAEVLRIQDFDPTNLFKDPTIAATSTPSSPSTRRESRNDDDTGSYHSSNASPAGSDTSSSAGSIKSTSTKESAFKSWGTKVSSQVSLVSKVKSSYSNIPKCDYRITLPVPVKNANFSLWAVLKNALGKDLSKISMPVHINEPLSLLQRLAEYMEYCELIQKAAEMDSPVARMEYVCAFAVSTQSSVYKRMRKPFNPLLGETYEYVRPDMGFRFVAEQVSHHPPVSAFYGQGREYITWGSIQPKAKFSGNTLDIRPIGTVSILLKRHKETYSWSYVDSSIRNVVMGTMWLENKGKQEVSCSGSNMKGVLTFKSCDCTGEENFVEGFVYDNKVPRRALHGSWAAGLHSSEVTEYKNFLADKSRHSAYSKKKKSRKKQDDNISLASFNFELPQQTTLWAANPRPSSLKQYFMMTAFAITLNELLTGHHNILPPTDSRFRGDIRLLENGKLDEADEEKRRLEQNQRDVRASNAASGIEHSAKWFVPSGTGDNQTWQFTDKYWGREWDREWKKKAKREKSKIAKAMVNTFLNGMNGESEL